MVQYNQTFKWKFYSVRLNGKEFFMVDKGKTQPISDLWQTLEQALLQAGVSYAVVMPQGEVITYGETIGFIKDEDKKLINQKLINIKLKELLLYQAISPVKK